jgi:hypothetical protein
VRIDLDPSTSAAGLAALNRFDFTTWDDVVATLERHGFQLSPQESTVRSREQMWLITSTRASGITLIGDTQVLYFAMGLAAAEEFPVE